MIILIILILLLIIIIVIVLVISNSLILNCVAVQVFKCRLLHVCCTNSLYCVAFLEY